MDLYQELILEHSKRPVGAGLREPYLAEVHHVNPTCGDEVTLRVNLDPQRRELLDISYQATGCSISRASTSVMFELLAEHAVADLALPMDAMQKMLTSRGSDPGDEDILGDGVALSGVAKYPARVKCALLGWMALKDALAQAGVEIPQESTPSPQNQKETSA
jgi:nitrogen fixation protein NifU and related proteins